MLDRIKIILVKPSHPGNVGAVARAMKTMGLSRLCMVSPCHFHCQEATVRASGADDLLATAEVYDSLETAIADCQTVYATSARSRALPWPTGTARSCADQMATEDQGQMAVVFGCESSGLSNTHLSLCDYHLVIPTVSHFSSLNLASAVQIVCYELFCAAQQPNKAGIETPQDSPLADSGSVTGLIEAMTALMQSIGFLDPKHPKLLIQRLSRLFHRARLEKTEVHILRGLVSNIEKKMTGSSQ